MTVSVIFYFTAEFQAVTPDIEGHIGGLIENTNVAFLRSNIPVQLAIHCIVKSPVGEAPDSAARIREFKQSRGEQNLNSISIMTYLVPVYGLYVVLRSLSLLLLTTSVSTCLPHSHNQVKAISVCLVEVPLIPLLQAVSGTYFSLQILQSS